VAGTLNAISAGEGIVSWKRRWPISIQTVVFFVVAGMFGSAAAGIIAPPSHQLQHVIPGDPGAPPSVPGTWADLSTVPGFAPGPPIPFEGVPMGLPGHGNTDTVVEILGPPVPPGGTGTIDVEMVALSLQSVDPIDIGGTLFDVEIQLSSTMPSFGTFDIVGHNDVFSDIKVVSSFDVFFDISATEVGNPTNVIFAPGVQDTLTGFSELPWIGFIENASHIPSPLYPTPPGWPSGGFYWNNFSGFPDFNVLNGAILDLAITPAIVPIPAALWLFVPAMAGLILMRRRLA
jgi:hypothetical protein